MFWSYLWLFDELCAKIWGECTVFLPASDLNDSTPPLFHSEVEETHKERTKAKRQQKPSSEARVLSEMRVPAFTGDFRLCSLNMKRKTVH